jgi:hypothetical protein
MRAALDRAGWFAHRHLTGPSWSFQLTRARSTSRVGVPDALAQAASPGGPSRRPDVLYVIAESWRQLGRPATARRVHDRPTG